MSIRAVVQYSKLNKTNYVSNKKSLFVNWTQPMREYTPLNFSFELGNEEAVKLFLNRGADVNASDKDGNTALHFTTLRESKSQSYYWMSGSESQRGSWMRHIEKPNININGEIAKLLLNEGANVDAETKEGITTLHAAAKKGYIKIVEALLKKRANVNGSKNNDLSPLHVAAHAGHKEVVNLLLEYGAAIDPQTIDVTPLHLSALKGYVEISNMLLNNGANINAKQRDGMTPLNLGTYNNHKELIKVLLEYGGADIDSINGYGATALHTASQRGLVELVETFLDFGCDINITDKDNEPPFNHVINKLNSFQRRLNDHESDEFDDFDFDPYSGKKYELTAEALKRHIVKMKTANLYVSEKNLLLMKSSGGLIGFEDECNKEIASMKGEKINNANISFYDILAEGISSLATCMANEDIVQGLEADEYKTKFPIYASMIKSNFRKGMERKELLEQGYKIFRFLFHNFPELPYVCTEKVFSYMSDGDLRTLMVACKPLGIRKRKHNNNE